MIVSPPVSWDWMIVPTETLTFRGLPLMMVSPYSDLDFQRPPSYDGSTMELSGLPSEPPAHKITYDELRKKNRDEYEIQRSRFIPRAPPTPVSDPLLLSQSQPSTPTMYSNPDTWAPGPGEGNYNDDPYSK
uniref:Uncharacterized protein n=1 Tax=Cacopsylla melanoneura TaxID=428564 RepID=A0A8D9BSN3_9HEMI